MTEFFTMEFLGTFTGMVAFVTAVTQLIKYYINVDPKWISLIAALVGQLTVQLIFIKDYSTQGIVLSLFNVIAVLVSSIGVFETAIKPIQRKIEDDKLKNL